ncbi:MAG: hypothetical protein KDK29_03595 [Sedimentitalea sp.]|nr:hypothetical protein [Sedimentitalea sp.]
MQDRKTLRRHAELLDAMAQRLSVDLEDAVFRGDLRPDEIADAVLRCADCPNPRHCAEWLLNHPRGAETTPQFCRNRAELERLRGGAGR